MGSWAALLPLIAFSLAVIASLALYVYASFAPRRSARDRRQLLVYAVLPPLFPICLQAIVGLVGGEPHVVNILGAELVLWALFSIGFLASNGVYYEMSERRLTRLVAKDPPLARKPILRSLIRFRLWFRGLDDKGQQPPEDKPSP